MGRLNSVISEYLTVPMPVYIDQDELMRLLLKSETPRIDGTVKLTDRLHFLKSDGNIRTVIGVIPAQELIDLVKVNGSEGQINEEVFHENIRLYKPTHNVNKEIIETAKSEDNYQFFYLNNGVTLICDKFIFTPNTRNPQVAMENIRIINGGQTTHSLFEVYKETPRAIDNIDLLLRICEVRQEDAISKRISQTTNNQIPVANRDLRSNDQVQKKIQKGMEELGYYYERKPNEHRDKPKSKVINNELAGQLIMAYHLGMPSEAKNSKILVFTSKYDDIFDEEKVTAEEILRLVSLYDPILNIKKEIQKRKRRKEKLDEKDAFISRATFHILYGLSIIINHEAKVLEAEDLAPEDKKVRLQAIRSDSSGKLTKLSIDMIRELVQSKMAVPEEEFNSDKFFKEIPTNIIIRDHILGMIRRAGHVSFLDQPAKLP